MFSTKLPISFFNTQQPVAVLFLLVAASWVDAQDPLVKDSSDLSAAGVSTVLSPTPLVDALKARQFEQAGKMLVDGVSLNATQPDGMTALHWAASYEVSDLVQGILQRGADPQAVNRYGVTPLSLACQNGDEKTTSLLLKAGADPNCSLPGGETPLMTAARTGRLGPVSALLAGGAKVDAKNIGGQSAIMWAAAEGHLDVVDALINANADYRRALKSGFTPLFFAARQGKQQVVFRLLAAGLDVNEAISPEKPARKGPRKGTSLLGLATENGHFELATALLSAGANANDSRVGYAPLHAITWVRKPIRGDGDPSPIGSGSVGSLVFVRNLVAAGADVNGKHGRKNSGNGQLNRTDATAFLLACETGDLSLMKLLLELGADPKLTNADDCPPLLAAAGVGILSNGDDTAGTQEQAIEAVALLLTLGADLNAVDKHGNTAMHGAAFKSWTKLIAFLVDNGADQKIWDKKNRFGWTPLMIAQGNRPGNFRPSAETIKAVELALSRDSADQ